MRRALTYYLDDDVADTHEWIELVREDSGDVVLRCMICQLVARRHSRYGQIHAVDYLNVTCDEYLHMPNTARLDWLFGDPLPD